MSKEKLSREHIQQGMNAVKADLKAAESKWQPTSAGEYYKKQGVFALLSNEKGVKAAISKALTLIKQEQKQLPKQLPKLAKVLNLALVVGEGSLFSWAEVFEERGIDGIICIDIDDGMLKHMEFMRGCFIKAKNFARFKRDFCKKHPLIGTNYRIVRSQSGRRDSLEERLTPDILARDLDEAANDDKVGDRHFSHPSKFATYQKIISRMGFVTINLDITSLEQCQLLHQQLKKNFPGFSINISLYNVTNVFDFTGDISAGVAFEQGKIFAPRDDVQRCASVLCAENSEPPLIAYSIINIVNKTQISNVCQGLDNFEEEMRRYVSYLNLNRALVPSSSSSRESRFLHDAKNSLGPQLRRASGDRNQKADSVYMQLVKYAQQAGVIDNAAINGNTALFWAMKSGQAAKAKVLIDHGADPWVINKDGENLFMLANTPELRELLPPLGLELRQASSKVEKKLDQGARADYLEIVKKAQKYKLIDDPSPSNQNTAFLWAIAHGQTDKAKILLEHGANAFAVNEENENAYTLARKHKDPTRGKLLAILPPEASFKAQEDEGLRVMPSGVS